MVKAIGSTVGDLATYTVLGVLLILFNTPTLIVLLRSSSLRLRYAVLAALLLPCSLNGVQCLGHVFTRLATINRPSLGDTTSYALWCVSNPTNLLDQFTFTAVPVMLLTVSIDRWLVVSYPLKYYNHTNKCVIVQIISAYIFTFVLQAITIVWTALYNNSAVVCARADYLPPELYTLLLTIRVGAATLSIVFMLIVPVKLKRHMEASSQYYTNARLRVFMRRQRSYTNAMLISCGFTFALFVLPTCVSLYGRFAYSDFYDLSRYTRFITFFNSFNMVIILIVRTPEIKQALRQIFGCSFSKTLSLTNTSTMLR